MPDVLRPVAVVLATLSLACAAAEPAPSSEVGPGIVLVSWNVNYGLRGDPEVVALIEELDGDVVLLQECTPALEHALGASRAVRQRYPHARFHDREGPGGLAVLSRFPIVTDELLPEVTWFPAWRGVVATPLGPVQFLNVHLRPPFDDEGSMVAGLLVTPALRAREMSSFATALDEGLPTVVAGDFNEESGGALDVLRARGMQDALEKVRGVATTWRWSGVPIRLRLDHVFADEDELAVREAAAIERGRSDHFPIVVAMGKARPEGAQRH